MSPFESPPNYGVVYTVSTACPLPYTTTEVIPMGGYQQPKPSKVVLLKAEETSRKTAVLGPKRSRWCK